MKFTKPIIYAILTLLAPFILRGQHIPYRLYTPLDGLPQSQVQCVFQDSRGYIWVGTAAGVCYFNGVKFQRIMPKDGLPHVSIKHIQEDEKGNIRFSSGRFLCTYNGKKLTIDTPNIRLRDGNFCIDDSKTIWGVNRDDKKLYYTKDWKNWACASDEFPILKDKKWHYVHFDPTFKRLNLIEHDAGHFYVFDKKELKKIYASRINIYGQGSNMYQDLACAKDSIFEIQAEGLKFLHKTSNNIEIHHLIKREKGKIYFTKATQGNTIYSIDAAHKMDSIVLKEAINFLFIDRDKNTWAATEQGLLRLFYDGFQNFDQKDLTNIWSIVEDREGGMWFGSLFKPAEIKYLKNGKLSTKTIDYTIKPSIPKQYGQFYFSGQRDAQGNLYFPMNWGIMKYDGKTFSAFDKATNSEPISLFCYLDNANNRLVSASNGGVNVVDLKTGNTQYYGEAKGLHRTSYVLGIGKDGKDNYWLGLPNGIARLDLKRDSIVKNYSNDLKNFPYYSVMTVFGDYKGTIWAGSAQGLLRYDEQKDSFVLVAPTIIQSGINSLASIKDHYLVIGASDGVYFLDLNAFYTDLSPDNREARKIRVRCFNQHNGYLGIEPNQNVLYVDSKDNVWIAASDIVTKITPSELDLSPKPLTPYITSINNEPIAYTDYAQIITLPYGENTAKIFFEAIGFERPFKTEFSYKLDNEKWSEWREEDFAVMDNLSSGTYQFYVKTRPFGTTNEEEIRETFIRFSINVPFYKQAYFPIIAALMLLLGGFVSWYLINQQQKKELMTLKEYETYKQNQEELNKERTRQIKYLQIQTLQAQLNPHFIFNVLQAIQTRIYEGSRESASRLIVDLGNLIRRFLEASINMDVAKIRHSEITLKQEIQLLKSYIEFEQLQYSNRFDYTILIDEDIEPDNVQVPPMLIQPYIENAIKHGILYEKERRCQLTIHFKKTDNEMLACTITDNGVGRKKAKELQDSFIRMYKSRGTEILEQRIKIMQELGHGISVETHDNPEGGTIVELKIDM